MDVRTPYPYSVTRNGISNDYKKLTASCTSEVVVLGAGISGALAAWYLHKAGIECMIVDKHMVGLGSTAASTSLIQYETDVPLIKLSRLYGEKKAIRSYELGIKALHHLEKICTCLGLADEFQLKSSLQFASFKKDIDLLKNEYRLRKQAGFDLEMLDRDDILKRYKLIAPSAILTHQAAQLDVYQLTSKMFSTLYKENVRVYTNTEIKIINWQKRNIELITENGLKIKTKYLVIATGYESGKYIRQNIEQLKFTYAFISTPILPDNLWENKNLIWETAKPYMYMRVTKENNILVGGKDSDYSDHQSLSGSLYKKGRALKQSFEKKFPGLKITPQQVWAGVFSSTKDGLPYIGSVPYLPKTYFALGFGGNGITFSEIAARQIVQMIKGKTLYDHLLFAFDR